MGNPRRNMAAHKPTVNLRRCFSKVWGQLSTIPVTRASTLQNSESIPNTLKIGMELFTIGDANAEFQQDASQTSIFRDAAKESLLFEYYFIGTKVSAATNNWVTYFTSTKLWCKLKADSGSILETLRRFNKSPYIQSVSCLFMSRSASSWPERPVSTRNCTQIY